MGILAGIINFLALILSILVRVFYFLIIARVILSWMGSYAFGFISEIIFKLTEPILRPLRTVIRVQTAGLDLSPLFALLALFLIERFLINWLLVLSANI
jgi:YggT family protein